ncbi:hypothetical protein ACLB1R_01115 [Escherichia coli]
MLVIQDGNRSLPEKRNLWSLSFFSNTGIEDKLTTCICRGKDEIW